jgi:DNA polymerase-3 subunit beta
MELTATKEQLLPPLMRAAAACGGGTLPVLEHLLLRPGDALSVTGTDMETEIVASGDFPAGGVAIALPGRKLVNIIRNLPDGADVSISVGDERCSIRSGRSRYLLATVPADSFPAFDRDRNNPRTTLTIGADVLLRALTRVRFAAGKADVRYYLNGVHVQIDQGSLLTVASDGHRIAVCETALDGDEARTTVVGNGQFGDKCFMILPNGGVDEIMLLLKGARGDVQMMVSKSCAEVIADETSFATKLIEGTYPPWQRVVPRDYCASFTAERQSLVDSLRRMATLADEKFCGVELTVDGDLLTLRLHNSVGENAEEQLELANVEGDPGRQGFNAHYLIDALSVAETERVEFSIAESRGVRITDTTDTGWQAVVMPMRL